MGHDNIPVCFHDIDDAFDCDYGGLILIGNCLVKLIHNQSIATNGDHRRSVSTCHDIHSTMLPLYQNKPMVPG